MFDIEVVENATRVANINPESVYEKVVAQMLAEYLEYCKTNLTPQQLNEVNNLYLEKCEEVSRYEKINQECIDTVGVGIGMMPLKFKEFFDDFKTFDHYRKLNEQGRLVELPCKVGDTVYILDIEQDRIITTSIVEIKLGNDKGKVYEGFYTRNGSETRFFLFSKIDKNVFLTRAEAEKALAESVSKDEC